MHDHCHRCERADALDSRPNAGGTRQRGYQALAEWRGGHGAPQSLTENEIESFQGLESQGAARRRRVEAREGSISRGFCVRRNLLPPRASASEPPISRALLLSPTLRMRSELLTRPCRRKLSCMGPPRGDRRKT